jgi:membrane-associated PAP2 superfamily phosphatase
MAMPLMHAEPRDSASEHKAWKRDLVVLLLSCAALLVWDHSGLDLSLTRWFGNAQGFAWRDHWLTDAVLHRGGRAMGWALLAALVLNVCLPLPWGYSITRRERALWLGSTLSCVAVVALARHASLSSCPWSLTEFGGTARHLSHWSIGVSDGGPGQCFPSLHAGGAFAGVTGWFMLRSRAPSAAKRWLCLSLFVGTVVSWAQLMRGAHFASDALWAAWLCFVTAAVLFHGFHGWCERGSMR